MAVRAASESAGLVIASISATYNMIHPDLGERERGRRGFEAIASAAGRMGTRLLTLCTGTGDPLDQWKFHPDNAGSVAWDEMCKEFCRLLPIADKHDVILGVEPELANVVSSAERAGKLLDTFRNDRIRIVFDPANLFEVATPERQRFLIDSAIDLLGDSIALAHAKDRREDGTFATAGTGVLDYPHYLSGLRRSGFTGALIAHGFAAKEAPGVALFLKNQLAALEKSQ